MFEIKKSITGYGEKDKIWKLYSDVSRWSIWDKSVKAVALTGEFVEGSNGVMEMINGMKMPFVISECTSYKSFSTKSELGNICIVFIHNIEQNENQVTISHKIIIEGGEERQMEGIGNQISEGLDECLQRLIAMSNEQ